MHDIIFGRGMESRRKDIPIFNSNLFNLFLEEDLLVPSCSWSLSVHVFAIAPIMCLQRLSVRGVDSGYDSQRGLLGSAVSGPTFVGATGLLAAAVPPGGVAWLMAVIESVIAAGLQFDLLCLRCGSGWSSSL